MVLPRVVAHARKNLLSVKRLNLIPTVGFDVLGDQLGDFLQTLTAKVVVLLEALNQILRVEDVDTDSELHDVAKHGEVIATVPPFETLAKTLNAKDETRVDLMIMDFRLRLGEFGNHDGGSDELRLWCVGCYWQLVVSWDFEIAIVLMLR